LLLSAKKLPPELCSGGAGGGAVAADCSIWPKSANGLDEPVDDGDGGAGGGLAAACAGAGAEPLAAGASG
jgi:hypothetical protein